MQGKKVKSLFQIVESESRRRDPIDFSTSSPEEFCRFIIHELVDVVPLKDVDWHWRPQHGR